MSRTVQDSGKDKILDAAFNRFVQWGYSGTSISTLAADLGMTKAALYYHFADKEALFLAVVERYLGDISGDLAQLPPLFAEAQPQEALAALAQVFLNHNERGSQIQRLSFQESRHLSPRGYGQLGQSYHRAVVEPLSDLLATATDRGWLRKTEGDEPAAIWIFLGLLEAFLGHCHKGQGVKPGSACAFARLLQGAIGPS